MKQSSTLSHSKLPRKCKMVLPLKLIPFSSQSYVISGLEFCPSQVLNYTPQTAHHETSLDHCDFYPSPLAFLQLFMQLCQRSDHRKTLPLCWDNFSIWCREESAMNFHSKSFSRSTSSEYSQNFHYKHDFSSISSAVIYCLGIFLIRFYWFS